MSEPNKDVQAAALLVLGCAALVLTLVATMFALPFAVAGIGGFIAYRFFIHSPWATERKSRQHTFELYHRAKALTSSIPDKEAFAVAIYKQLPSAPEELETTMIAATLELYDLEYPYVEVPPPPAVCNSLEGGRYRDLLSSYSSKVTRADLVARASKAIVESFEGFLRYVPKSKDGPAFATLPLSSFIQNLGGAIQALITPYFEPDVVDQDLFKPLRTTFDRNLNATGDAKKSIMPEDYEGDDAADVYLRGTPFYDLLSVPIPFTIPEKTRYEGHYVIAPSGRGKTTYLRYQFNHDLEQVEKGEASIIVMDSKGEFINDISRLKAFAPGGSLNEKLCLLEYDSDYPLALNPLDLIHRGDRKAEAMHTVSLLEYVFGTLLETNMTTFQSTLFRSVLQAIVEAIPNPSIQIFRDIIANGYEPYIEYIRKLDPDLQNFFYKEFNARQYQATKEQVTWRMRALLGNPAIKAMFSSPTTKLDIGKEMDAGKVIIINNNIDLLDELGAEFFGRFMIALVLAAARRRSSLKDHEKMPVYFYIDECHTVIARDENIAKIIDQCRSQKIAMLLAHQRLQQLKLPDVKDALANCAIRFANSDEDAKELAPKLRTTPERLRIPKGQFVAHVRDVTTQGPVTLTIPNTFYRADDFMSASEQRAVRTSMRERYSYQPEGGKEEPAEAEYPSAAPVILKAAEPKKKKRKKGPRKPDEPTYE